LAKILSERKVNEVEVVGLALDYCVKSTVISAREFGLETRLLRKCTRAVDPACERDVLDALRETWGVKVID
jgi:nicotinamidase-related amidase